MSLAETFLIISILYMSMTCYFYFWQKKYNKNEQTMKIWPLGFFFICCSAYFLSFISYPQYHFRQFLSISLIFLWSLIVFIQINRRLKKKQGIQKEQKMGWKAQPTAISATTGPYDANRIPLLGA